MCPKAVESILALRPGMPIILLSAYTDFDLCRLAYDEKLVSYVAKWEEFGREPKQGFRSQAQEG